MNGIFEEGTCQCMQMSWESKSEDLKIYGVKNAHGGLKKKGYKASI